ncbi:hypothetical protein [Enterococcus ratti]|nr:hypothetical protein [Enterococcus ratti]
MNTQLVRQNKMSKFKNSKDLQLTKASYGVLIDWWCLSSGCYRR